MPGEATATAGVVLQWRQVKGLERSQLDTLLTARRALKDQIEALQEEVGRINSKLLGSLAKADVKSVMVAETRVTLVQPGPSEKLDKKKLWTRLLELKVPEKVVVKAYADATTMEERTPYVLVTEPKEKV